MQIGNATVTYYERGAFTTYPDGASYAAEPHSTAHYHVVAHRCGYGDDLLAYSREHEAAHHMVAEWLCARRSDVLWPLAHGYDPDPSAALLEETAAMTLQRWLRANERPIVGGVDWDEIKRRALTLLDAAR